MVSVIILRFQGYQEFLATYFSDIRFVSHNVFLSHSLGFRSLKYGQFSYTSEILNLKLPSDKSFGMPLDTLSYLYLSNDDTLSLVFLLTLWIVLLVACEKLLLFTFNKYKNSIFYIMALNLFVLAGLVQPTVKDNFFILPVAAFLIATTKQCLLINQKKERA
ncbi:hypothetical protein [Halobacteriovorax marinus]|uniref:hypothetical protein n=1 Tax=Halobacteriovorax marinus TaxID=97084 RepID=UPI003A913174